MCPFNLVCSDAVQIQSMVAELSLKTNANVVVPVQETLAVTTFSYNYILVISLNNNNRTRRKLKSELNGTELHGISSTKWEWK